MHYTNEELRQRIAYIEEIMPLLTQALNREGFGFQLSQLKQRLAWQIKTGRTF